MENKNELQDCFFFVMYQFLNQNVLRNQIYEYLIFTIRICIIFILAAKFNIIFSKMLFRKILISILFSICSAQKGIKLNKSQNGQKKRKAIQINNISKV